MAGARHRYVALLRAINVGGTSVVTMARLRRLVQRLGFHDVSTYIQSGNVLFTADEADRTRVQRMLEAGLGKALGHAVKVFLLTPGELKRAAERNPFPPTRLKPDQRGHVMFLEGAPDEAHLDALTKVEAPEYRLKPDGHVLYYSYVLRPGKNRKTLDLERILDRAATSRTGKVVEALVEKTG